MAEHYAIRSGYAQDWEGRQRAFVALDVRYDDNYHYQERERWWFNEASPGCSEQSVNPAMAAKIHELMETYFTHT